MWVDLLSFVLGFLGRRDLPAAPGGGGGGAIPRPGGAGVRSLATPWSGGGGGAILFPSSTGAGSGAAGPLAAPGSGGFGAIPFPDGIGLGGVGGGGAEVAAVLSSGGGGGGGGDDNVTLAAVFRLILLANVGGGGGVGGAGKIKFWFILFGFGDRGSMVGATGGASFLITAKGCISAEFSGRFCAFTSSSTLPSLTFSSKLKSTVAALAKFKLSPPPFKFALWLVGTATLENEYRARRFTSTGFSFPIARTLRDPRNGCK